MLSLTPWQVWFLRKIYNYGVSKWTQEKLAEKLNVSVSTTGKAIRNQGPYKGIVTEDLFQEYKFYGRYIRYCLLKDGDIKKGNNILKTLRNIGFYTPQNIGPELPDDSKEFKEKFFIIDTDNCAYFFLSNRNWEALKQILFKTIFLRIANLPIAVSPEYILSWNVLPWPEPNNERLTNKGTPYTYILQA